MGMHIDILQHIIILFTIELFICLSIYFYFYNLFIIQNIYFGSEQKKPPQLAEVLLNILEILNNSVLCGSLQHHTAHIFSN